MGTSRRTGTALVAGVGLRAGAFVAGSWVYSRIYQYVVNSGADDNGLGEGLLAFALTAGVASLWGARDGIRFGFLRAAVLWIATGVIVGTVQSLAVDAGAPGADLHLMLADLRELGPFLAGITLVPALLSAAIAAAASGQWKAADQDPARHG